MTVGSTSDIKQNEIQVSNNTLFSSSSFVGRSVTDWFVGRRTESGGRGLIFIQNSYFFGSISLSIKQLFYTKTDHSLSISICDN